MKLSVAIFSLLLYAGICAAQTTETSPKLSLGLETDGITSSLERTRWWKRLIPDHAKLQYAGSIGMFSTGPGWTYGRKKQWETDILLGFVPKFESDKAKFVLTLKETYLPWLIRVKESDWLVQPLTASFFASSVWGGNFWTFAPDRYPSGYWGFTTRVRLNLSMGERVMFDVPERWNWCIESLSAYYELGVNDLDIATFFGDKSIKFRKILSLSFGVKATF